MTSPTEISARDGARIPLPAPSTGQAAKPGIDVVVAVPASADAVAAVVPRPGLPVLPPFTALLEILLLIILPTLLDQFVPAFPSLSALQPHPFWLPVLLVSLQYGTVSGLLAAGAAIAASSFLGLPEQEVGEDHFTYLLRVWAQPVLWLAAAIILGQFRMRQIEQKQELDRQVAELTSQRASIAAYAGNLRERCEWLEREMVGRRAPASGDLLGLLGRIGSADAATSQTALDACFTVGFGKCQASIYVKVGDELRAVERHGWPPGAPWRASFGPADPVYAAIVGEARSLTVLTPGDEVILSGEGLAAVPILSQHDGRVAGMLKIEAAEPTEIEATLAARLSALAHHVAPILDSTGVRTQASLVPGMPRRSNANTSDRPRLWRQLRWRRGQAPAVDAARPTRTG